MTKTKGVIEWRTISEFPEWEIASNGNVRHKLTGKTPEKKPVGATYWVVLTNQGRESLRGIRALMRKSFPEVIFD